MTEPLATPQPSHRRNWLTAGAIALAFVAGGLTLPVLTASAQEAAMGHTGGMMGHGDMHAMGKAHLERMLIAVDATPEQKAKINAILENAFRPMADMHGGMRESHAALIAALTGPTVDRGALERIRAAHITQADQMSRTVVAALADAADVLRPDQRAKLAAMMAAHANPQ